MINYLVALILLVILIIVIADCWIRLINYLKRKYLWVDRLEVLLVFVPPVLVGLYISLQIPKYLV